MFPDKEDDMDGEFPGLALKKEKEKNYLLNRLENGKFWLLVFKNISPLLISPFRKVAFAHR